MLLIFLSSPLPRNARMEILVLLLLWIGVVLFVVWAIALWAWYGFEPSPPLGRVILTTFAGRRDRIVLLFSYALHALKRGDVDQFHVWDFCRDPADRAWIQAWCEDHEEDGVCWHVPTKRISLVPDRWNSYYRIIVTNFGRADGKHPRSNVHIRPC